MSYLTKEPGTISWIEDHIRPSDVLYDIGANIGLTSCQNGNDFAELHMFEPNPLCQHILEVNTALTLTKPKVTIHRFALGAEDKRTRLMVPRHSWGGVEVTVSRLDSYFTDNPDEREFVSEMLPSESRPPSFALSEESLVSYMMR